MLRATRAHVTWASWAQWPALLRDRITNDRGDNRQAGFTWAQDIGNAECPYLRRWVFNFGAGSLRVHHWHASDDPRALHDHPWDFATLVLKGGYTDISSETPEATGSIGDPDEPESARRTVYSGIKHDHLGVGSIRFRRANHAHTVNVDPGGAWTIMLTGRHSRDWGFWTADGWVRMRRFFKLYGHHPCES